MQYWSIKTSSIPEQVYNLQQSSFTVSNNSSLARKTYSRPDNKNADDLKKRLLETAEKQIRIDPGNTWAIQVKGRLISINDLVEEEALLDKRCKTNFPRGSSFNTDGTGGRKQDDFRLELIDELCTWLETELEHSLFTMEQMHQKMISMDKSLDKSLVYSKKHLRNILADRYQEKMYFTSQERQTDVLCFKDMSASIIREYHDKTEDDDRSVYPSITEMIDPDRQLELVPESVKLLLRPILKSDIKVAFWGQNLIRCSRPRLGVVPLPLRFVLQLDHRFSSK